MYKVGKCRLNEILEKKRMTQVDLAIKLGLKKQQVNSYILENKIMTLQTAKNIANILDVNIEELYDFVWFD